MPPCEASIPITISGNYLAQLDLGRYMEMREAVSITVSGRLAHDVIRFPIRIKSQDLRERQGWTFNCKAANRGGGAGAPIESPPKRWSAFPCIAGALWGVHREPRSTATSLLW